jgi:hypothetical protein
LELASALHVAGRLAEAEPLYRQVLAAQPGLAVARDNLIALLRAQDRWSEAEGELRAGLALRPDDADLQFRLGVMLLAGGRYAEGWPLYEARRRMPKMSPIPPLSAPEWRGEPVRDLLVWYEQGFGDMIMFGRFLPLVAQRGTAVTVVCRPPLVRLLEGLGVTAVATDSGGALPPPQAWTLAGSLPLHLGITLETLPSAPYLSASPRGRGGTGVAWRGSPGHRNDRNRSLPAELAAELLVLPGVIDLDPAATGARDFQETAEIVAGLDHVVSVDTSVAHLAGAMGKPVSILLPRLNTDWRWLRGRADSPWYPSARLYRQARAGDWANGLAAVRRDLTAGGLS